MSDHLIIETMRLWAKGLEPVWSHDEILLRWGMDFEMYRRAWLRPLEREFDVSASVERIKVMYDLRTQAVREFGFSVPCKELLDELERHQPIVEVGAGSGFMTALMRHRGIDVVGTDSGRGHGSLTLKRWDAGQLEMPAKRAVRHFRDRTVFCSWPSLQETWFRQALRAMRIGQKAIIIEEDCCAEETTWCYREDAFERLADIPLPAWPMLNDRAASWVKKRERKIAATKLWRDEKGGYSWEGPDVGTGDGREDTGDAVDGEAAAQGGPPAPPPAAQGQGA